MYLLVFFLSYPSLSDSRKSCDLKWKFRTRVWLKGNREEIDRSRGSWVYDSIATSRNFGSSRKYSRQCVRRTFFSSLNLKLFAFAFSSISSLYMGLITCDVSEATLWMCEKLATSFCQNRRWRIVSYLGSSLSDATASKFVDNSFGFKFENVYKKSFFATFE